VSGEAPRARIVHEDDWLAIVDKPAGLIVHAAPGHHGETLVDQLGETLGGGEDPERPGIVHRLDRDTSGLLVVARTEEAHRALSAAIAARAVKRGYRALVEGCPSSRTGTIDAPLGRDHRAPERVVVGGRRPREAVTHFEVAERIGRNALLDIRLETGRTHQIRAHMKAIGHPICGDPVYGRRGMFGLERQFLHAAHLAFAHPRDGSELSFSSDLPADLVAALARAHEGASDARERGPNP
jgi:23S rRNA pseudouridine1911/1915/1917 synthase